MISNKGLACWEKEARSLCRQAIEEEAATALAFAVGDRHGIRFLHVEGALKEGGQLATSCSLFDLASLTKLVGPGMGALVLMEKGTLPMGLTLGEVFGVLCPEEKKRITLFQLLTHTGGFPAAYHLYERNPDPSQAVAELLRYPLEKNPVTSACYSCMGFLALGFLLERVCSLPLERLCQELVWEPLGLARTGYCPARFLPGQPTVCTGLVGNCRLSGEVSDSNARFLGGIAGNAGVFSCLEDMTTFADFLSEECAPLLTKGLFRQAVSDQTKAFSIHRGLGFHLLPGDNPFTGNLFPKGCYGDTGFTGTSCFVEHHTGRYAVLLTNRVYYGKENQRLVRFRWLLHQAVRNAFR